MNQRGRFIVFEGGEACGKSTQARRLADRLDALFTFEPGATDLGRLIREIVLDQGNLHHVNIVAPLARLAVRTPCRVYGSTITTSTRAPKPC